MYPMWLIYIVIAIASTVTYLDDAMFFKSIQTERDKHQLEYAVNSASDAAVQQLQETSQLTPTGNTYVDPDFIWRVYKYTFLRSNNLWSKANMQNVETSFPSVVISVNDGYYMRLLVDTEGVNGHEKHYRFTQKMPYARTTQVQTITTGDDNNLSLDGNPDNAAVIPAGSVVADTLNGNNITVFKEGLTSSDGDKREYQIFQHDGNMLPHQIGSAHDLVDINKMLLEAIDYTMFYNSSSSSKESDKSMLAIPDKVSEQLLSPSVSFVGPTVFAFSDNFNLKGKSYFNYYSVGGAQIVTAANYYCYERDGKKYYSRLNPEKFQGSANSNIIQVYSSAKEAAEEGYYPDPLYY
ncbi:hypothetical protein [Lysinibacillus xylanilyticus]|uniref:hypothetical protein n=1 Tax=Lysinibacillus xylanilyticus TaxID=582475 RepID=UPI0036DB9BDC